MQYGSLSVRPSVHPDYISLILSEKLEILSEPKATVILFRIQIKQTKFYVSYDKEKAI